MSVVTKPQPTTRDAGPCGLLPYVEAACCVHAEPRETLADRLLLREELPLSAVQACCFCSGGETRVDSGIRDVPEIAGLAGITMQTDGGAENNVQTLKWATFDRARRRAKTRNNSGAVCCGTLATSQLSSWVVGLPGSCLGLCCMSLCMSCVQRQCDFTYLFEFSEDWRRADIRILLNCCCCVPCGKAWCRLPDWLVRFDMVQADGVADGSHWHRNSSSCGGPMKRTYELKAIFREDGTPARFHDIFVERAPRTYLMAR